MKKPPEGGWLALRGMVVWGRFARNGLGMGMREFSTIAAIIPLYNGAKFIKESVESVLAQTLPPTEILVVDDGSTDEGPAIVERLAKEHPITLLRKSNGGQSSARNFGVANSKSSLIALLDQDDIWYRQHLAELIEPFRKRRFWPFRKRRLGWTYSDIDMTDEAGRVMTPNFLRAVPREQPKRSLSSCLAQDMYVLPGACLIDRMAFQAVGGFDEQLRGYEDDDLFTRLLVAGYDNVFVPEALSQWRMVAESSGHSSSMLTSALSYMGKALEAYPAERSFILNRFDTTLSAYLDMARKAGDEDYCLAIEEGLRRIASACSTEL